MSGGVVALLAMVGGVLILNSREPASQPTVSTTITVQAPEPPDTSSAKPWNEPSPASPTPLTSAQATAFISDLYDAWTARDRAKLEASVVPAYQSSFDPDFLDRIGVYRVRSYNNTATVSGTAAEVCGSQLFYRDDGMVQAENRCFQVDVTASGPRVVWTGDQETVTPWYVPNVAAALNLWVR